MDWVPSSSFIVTLTLQSCMQGFVTGKLERIDKGDLGIVDMDGA